MFKDGIDGLFQKPAVIVIDDDYAHQWQAEWRRNYLIPSEVRAALIKKIHGGCFRLAALIRRDRRVSPFISCKIYAARGLAPQAIFLELLDRLFDLSGFQHLRRSDLKGERILLAERFELDGKPHRLAEIGAGGDHPVIGHQRAVCGPQRFQHRLRQFLGAIGFIGRAANYRTARRRDHVMDRRDLHATDSERGCMNGMGMHDGIYVLRALAKYRDGNAIRTKARAGGDSFRPCS